MTNSSIQPALFTLLVYQQNQENQQDLLQLLQLFQQQFPCKILWMVLGQGSGTIPTSPHWEVLQGEDNRWQELFLRVLPRLIPDLPIYVFCGDDPCRSQPLWAELEKLADRVLVDSQWAARFQPFCSLMQKWEKRPSHPPCIDLNWVRISGWRQLLAETFDSRERLEQLATSQRLTLYYQSTDMAKTIVKPGLARQAFYLQAWLAYKLGWHHSPNASFLYEALNSAHAVDLEIHYQGPKQEIKVVLSPAHIEEASAGEVVEIKVSGEGGYVSQMTRMAGDCVRVYSANQDQCSIPFTLQLSTLRSTKRVMQELFYQKPHPDYPFVLEQIRSHQP